MNRTLLSIGISTLSGILSSCNLPDQNAVKNAKVDDPSKSKLLDFEQHILDMRGKLRVHCSRINARNFQSAVIQVREVQVRSATTHEYLKFTVQNFDLDLVNLKDAVPTILGAAQVPVGSYDQIRLITVEDGRLTLSDGSRHEFKIPSGSKSGIKIFLEDVVEVTDWSLAQINLQFNLARSFVLKGNGNFNFKPVIRGTVSVIKDINPDDATEVIDVDPDAIEGDIQQPGSDQIVFEDNGNLDLTYPVANEWVDDESADSFVAGNDLVLISLD